MGVFNGDLSCLALTLKLLTLPVGRVGVSPAGGLPDRFPDGLLPPNLALTSASPDSHGKPVSPVSYGCRASFKAVPSSSGQRG